MVPDRGSGEGKKEGEGKKRAILEEIKEANKRIERLARPTGPRINHVLNQQRKFRSPKLSQEEEQFTLNALAE